LRVRAAQYVRAVRGVRVEQELACDLINEEGQLVVVSNIASKGLKAIKIRIPFNQNLQISS
jgi:hypothetical protein